MAPPVPNPPRLLNAATAALNASPWSGFAAVGDVIGAIMPTLTTGPAAAALGTAALAGIGRANSPSPATSKAARHVATLRISMTSPPVGVPLARGVTPSDNRLMTAGQERSARPGTR